VNPWSKALILFSTFFASPALSVFVPFTNCLTLSNPQQLQFDPLFVDIKFNSTDPKHNFNVTVYGNVTGQTFQGVYPPSNNTGFWDAPPPGYQITNATDNITTLFGSVDFLTYVPYTARPSPFCDAVGNHPCPLGPLFNTNASDPKQLHSFSMNHDFFGTYAFGTLATKIKVQSGDRGAAFVSCIAANATPDLGPSLSGALRCIPLVILGLVGFATLMAAKYGPGSSPKFFYWSSYYGRDENLLRLVTPGFADCLQYIQFIVLTGSLSLNYPGYYQPVVSKLGWSTLTFNESFVSHGNGSQSLTDGIYVTNGTYGLSDLRALVGMTKDEDIWAGMAIWLCVIILGSVLICQIGFAINWAIKRAKNSRPQDLRSLNLPFTAGTVSRIVFNFFLLPIVSLSMFQLVVAAHSPPAVVALAVILLIATAIFATWTFFLIFTANPRVSLFDHLPSLLIYGPLYNTYSDEAAPFAIVPVLLNFIRGISIGAIQPAGIAQLVILAICEIVFVLTIHAFRPFQQLTSMNAFHTFLSVARLVTVLLSIAFVPSLGVAEGVKGWIGYAVLLLHATVLIFGFFLNALQTLIETLARMSGAGENSGIIRVFGVRQLKKREERRHHRDSLGSSAAILESEYKSTHSHRLTSTSGGSAGRHLSFDRSSSAQFDRMSQVDSVRSGVSPGPGTPGTPGAASPLSFLPAAADSQHRRRPSGTLTAPAPYYRPPRPRRPTLDALSDQQSLELEGQETKRPAELSNTEIVEEAKHASILSPNLAVSFRDDSDADLRRNKTEYYMSRESDFLYGVRGPALSSGIPPRKRVTGPADPMSPMASATGWIRNLWGGRRKEKGKGFEVVRSTPLHMLPMEEEDEVGLAGQRYMDSPPPAKSDGTRGMSDVEMVDTPKMRVRPGQRSTDAPPLLRPLSLGPDLSLPTNMSEDTAYHPPKRSRAGTAPQQPEVKTAQVNRDLTADTGPENERSSTMGSSIYPESVEPVEHSDWRRASTTASISTGLVHHHIAGDSIHEYTLNPAHLGSAAELVNPFGGPHNIHGSQR
jgi:Transient receptor potential (TRP) ion channel/ML-like domain